MHSIDNIEHPLLGSLSFGLFERSDERLAEGISDLLVSCARQLSEEYGGHVPAQVVEGRILKYYTTVPSILKVTDVANRFVLLSGEKIVATALVANQAGVVMPEDTHLSHPNKFIAQSRRSLFENYHSVFNVAVRQNYRRHGLARTLMSAVAGKYRAEGIGKGFYVRSEPPEHDIWQRLGFEHVGNLDEFFDENVMDSEVFQNPQEYNCHYCCSCEKSENWGDLFNQRKLKYYGFVKKFQNYD